MQGTLASATAPASPRISSVIGTIKVHRAQLLASAFLNGSTPRRVKITKTTLFTDLVTDCT